MRREGETSRHQPHHSIHDRHHQTCNPALFRIPQRGKNDIKVAKWSRKTVLRPLERNQFEEINWNISCERCEVLGGEGEQLSPVFTASILMGNIERVDWLLTSGTCYVLSVGMINALDFTLPQTLRLTIQSCPQGFLVLALPDGSEHKYISVFTSTMKIFYPELENFHPGFPEYLKFLSLVPLAKCPHKHPLSYILYT